MPRNYPPSIEPSPTALYPSNAIVRLAPASDPAPDGGQGSSDLRLEVVVRDPNVDQRLEYQVFRDYTPSSPVLLLGGVIPATTSGDRLTRPLSIVLDRGAFSDDDCHRVELFVSAELDPGSNNRRPVEAGDLATMTWWVVSGDATLSDCERWR